MADNDVNLYLQREALIRDLLNMTDLDVIRKTRRALTRALVVVKQKEQEETADPGYISKEEQKEMLLDALTEMFRAERKGVKRKTLQEAIDEL